MFRCFKTILGASVIGGVLLGLMIKIPHFFEIIFDAIPIVLTPIAIALVLWGLMIKIPHFLKSFWAQA